MIAMSMSSTAGVQVQIASTKVETTTTKPEVHLDELGSLKDAVEPFSKKLIAERTAGSSVRLHCAIPTFGAASETCVDLYDLQALRSRSLQFIHKVVEKLESSGIATSYCLTPSSSPLCLLCASSPDVTSFKVQHAAVEALRDCKFCKRESVVLVDLEYGPAIVIT